VLSLSFSTATGSAALPVSDGMTERGWPLIRWDEGCDRETGLAG